MSLLELTAVELGKKIKSGEVKVVDAVEAVFEQIDKVEEDINSYVTVYPKDEVLANAKEVQEKIDNGELDGPLAGVPVAIKDNMCNEQHLHLQQFKI